MPDEKEPINIYHIDPAQQLAEKVADLERRIIALERLIQMIQS